MGCVGRVPRSTPIGSELLTLSAVDFDQGNSVTYRIVSGNEDGCFSLDLLTGALAVACDLSDLGISERYINVTATDGQHFADIHSIRMHLTGSTAQRGRSGKVAAASEPEELKFECRDTGLDRKLNDMMALAAKRQSSDDDQSVTELPPLPSRYGQNIHSPEFYDFPAQVCRFYSCSFQKINNSLVARQRMLSLIIRDDWNVTNLSFLYEQSAESAATFNRLLLIGDLAASIITNT